MSTITSDEEQSFKLPDFGDDEDGQAIRFILQARNEAKLAKWNSIQQTRENYDVYWTRQDFSHKVAGQSRETLPMQTMAVEQTANYFKQALVDSGDEWWSAFAKDARNTDKMKVKPEIIQTITQLHLNKANIYRHTGLGMKSGLLGAKFITKVNGKWNTAPFFVAERSEKQRKAKLRKGRKKVWELELSVVSQFNFYPDPTGAKLYEIEDMWLDYHQMMALAEGDDAIYDKTVCQEVTIGGDDAAEEKFDEMRRNNQNEVSHNFRGRVKITEFWGTILDQDGSILHENCVATLANDRFLIRKPTPNPLWHQKSPYESIDLMESPDAVWPRALADAGSKLNIGANELWNLMLDGAMRAANGVTQIRQDWLENPAQVENGIPPGTNLGVNSQCPPGAHVMELLQSGQVPPEAMNMYNLLNQEFNRAMLTSDIRQGMTPRKDISATQVVEANQTITSVFSGMTKQIEVGFTLLIEKCWETCAQFSDDMDQEELKAILGDDYDAFAKLTPEERFAATVNGIQYEVFGISMMQQKAQDFKKGLTLLQSIGASQPLMEAFVEKYSFKDFLSFLMQSLGLPTRQFERSQDEQDMMKMQQQVAQEPPGGGGGPGQAQAAPSPGGQSQADQQGSAAGPQAQAQSQGGPQ